MTQAQQWSAFVLVPTLVAGAMLVHGGTLHAGSQDAAAGSATALQLIRVTPSSSSAPTTIVLEADGPLPAPSSDAVDGPPRIFLDLPGVTMAPTLTRTGKDPRIRRARVARHSDNPLVTRVVFDLSASSSYRLDTTGLTNGRIVILLGEPAAPASRAAPLPSSRPASALPTVAIVPPSPRTGTPPQAAARPKPPTPNAPASSIPSRSNAGAPSVPSTRNTPSSLSSTSNAAAPTAPAAVPSGSSTPKAAAPAAKPPASGRRPAASGRSETASKVYTAQITTAVERLQALRPVLAGIDNRSEALPDLAAAAVEFDAVSRLLSGITPPSPRETTHALLIRACALGALAARTLDDAVRTGDSATRWNAASAAAGALMLLDRAEKDLGQ